MTIEQRPPWDALDRLRFFYPPVEPGGVMLRGDYGFTACPGATRAGDELLPDKPEEIVPLLRHVSW